CFVSEGSVTVVHIKSVGAEIIGHIEVVVAVVVRISVSQIERPAGGVNSHAVSDLSESAILIIVEDNYPAAVVRVLKAFREKPGRAGMKDVDWLEVAAKEQVHEAIVVIIERDRLNGIHVPVKARCFGHVSKLAVAHVLVKNAVAEAHYQ